MIDQHDVKKIKTGVVINVQLPSESDFDNQQSIEEIKSLSNTLGIEIIDVFTQKRKKISPSHFIGTGKLDEVKEYIKDKKVDSVIFDNEISGIQERNLEKYLDIPILSRTGVILNIFQTRAQTNEAKLQVELASMEYSLPRLRNLWTHFSRVEGGIGLRGGEGEKQLELDKRMIQSKINKIKKRLSKVDVQMKTRRKRRLELNTVSLAGYTNAGKTSLMNHLTNKKLLAKDMLFSTLGSNINKVYINDDLQIIMNDTVGFIKKLPHNLVASFKSTLDEITNSRLILHVIDASSPYIENNIKSVNDVLNEIDASEIKMIRVFNKMDLIDNNKMNIQTKTNEDDIFISTYTGFGINNLKEKIVDFFI